MNPRLKYFLENTSLHGFKHLVAADQPLWKRVYARFFWSIFIGCSIYCMCSILASSFDDFSSKTTSINLDTSYRDWTNTFPAISICMTKGRSTNAIKDYMRNYWETNNIKKPSREIRFLRSIQSLMFINFQQPLDGVNIESCLEYNETCGVDFEVLRQVLIPQSCRDFMAKVEFLGREIPCEDIFKLHRTEVGDCFMANSLYSNGKSLMNFRQLPLKHSNQDIIERSMKIRYTDKEFVIYKLFVHTPEEIPDGNLEGYGMRKAEHETYMAFKTTEMINQNDVKDESIENRQCRFPNEYLNEYKLPYSISNCRFNERMNRELKDCNCTLPIGEVPKAITKCNVTRFQCLLDSQTDFAAIRKSLDSPCIVPSCLSMEIGFIGQYDNPKLLDYGELIIDILNKPTLRYIRRVRVTKLDMIVQFGGIVGLFLGASILSLLEILFLVYDAFKKKFK